MNNSEEGGCPVTEPSVEQNLKYNKYRLYFSPTWLSDSFDLGYKASTGVPYILFIIPSSL